MKKDFPTEVVLSLTDGRLLCEFEKLHELVEFLAGEPVYTHQMAFRPFVEDLRSSAIAQHPKLASPEMTAAREELTVTLNGCPQKEVANFISGWLSRNVYPLIGRTLPISPAKSLQNMAESFTEPLKGKSVIVVEVD